MQERFHLDAPGWFQREEPLPHLATVADSVWSGARLDVGYRSGRGLVRRRLDPLGLVLKAGVWYLVAAHRGTPRTYRASRVVHATRLEAPAVRPDGFELATWWEASGAEFDRSILRLACTLLVDAPALGRLRTLVPGPTTAAALARADPPDARGRRRVELRVESVEVAVSQLAPLGGAVEVLDPPALRAALADHGAALAARNRAPT
jgi:predicted DNA-binding transcriptional regulator YafY